MQSLLWIEHPLHLEIFKFCPPKNLNFPRSTSKSGCSFPKNKGLVSFPQKMEVNEIHDFPFVFG